MFVCFLLLTLIIGLGQKVRAAEFIVKTTRDGGTGSLRAAITAANANKVDDTIILSAGTYLVTLKSNEDNNAGGDFDIKTSNSITIVGAGAQKTFIDGNGIDRVLQILQGTVTISGVTIQNGKTVDGREWKGENGPPGGGIYNAGNLTLINCVIKSNATGNGSDGYFSPAMGYHDPGNGGDGGGIYNEKSAILTISKCTINNNKTGRGCLYEMDGEIGSNGGSGGGIANLGTLSISLSTISGNTTGESGVQEYYGTNSSGHGGGIYSAGTLTINSCTITNNTTSHDYYRSNGYGRGGGIYSASSEKATLKNTIVAQNHCTSLNPTGIDCFGKFISQGYNLIQETNNFTLTGELTGNKTGVDPLLGALALKGGTTPTCALLAGSPAIDAGKSDGITEDQRGYARPYDTPGIPNVADSSDIGAYEANASINNTPFKLVLNRTSLNFTASIAGQTTPAQTFTVSSTGNGILKWTAQPNASWLKCSPSNGTGTGTVNVTVKPTGLAVGTYTSTITVSANTVNSPLTINVKLTVSNNSGTTTTANLPFGAFETPAAQTTVSGSIALTGWALDNIQVETVKIFRNPVQGEGNNPVYIADALFVDGARPDVETAYPDYPSNYNAGWGYLLLTNTLPNNGNGTFTFYAIATDGEGNSVTLGEKTIISDNEHAAKPFGAIDTPLQGGIASGKDFLHWGWALTPLPSNILIDGSTIDIMVDGVNIGHPVYNICREDLATLFPDYANSNGAAGYFYLDTTTYENGIHTITWIVTDSNGNTDGIGSRYFQVQNDTETVLSQDMKNASASPTLSEIEALPSIHEDMNARERNHSMDMDTAGSNQGQSVNVPVIIPELGHIELCVGKNLSDVKGYMEVGNQLRRLPIGSTLDKQTGNFSWAPGPGFYGNYHLVFVMTNNQGQSYKKTIEIVIKAKE